MPKVINTSTTLGITLTSTDNPVTITSSGTINAAAGTYALLGPAGTYSVTNYGLVSDTAASGIGIGLLAGGTVTNSAATAAIVGMTYGIKVAGAAGAVNNFGTINVKGGSNGRYASAIKLAAGGSVTNQTGGIISGGTTNAFGVSAVTSATVTNAGTITAAAGIMLDAGGSVNNQFIIQAATGDAIYADASASITNSGRITGYNYGIVLLAGGSITNTVHTAEIDTVNLAAVYTTDAFSIINAGTLFGGGEGVLLGPGAAGVLDNMTTGLIQGAVEVGVESLGAGTITNDGQISGVFKGVYLRGGGSVTNTANGQILGSSEGGIGVVIKGGAGTIINSGHIDGGATAAVFASGYANLLELIPGAAFSSLVNGGNTIGAAQTSTIDLVGGTGTGTISNVGVSFVNFGSVAFNTGDFWMVSGNTAGIAGGEVFGAFAQGDTLQITGVAGESISGFSGGTLTLTGSANLKVDFSAVGAGSFHVQNDGSVPTATDITLVCYAEGTRILTPAGEVRIEDLREGDQVVTVLNGATAPVVWNGWRRVQPTRHRRPETMQPVRIRAGAFGEGRPHTDLRVSPEHAIYVDGVLVPARLLVNGETIFQEAVAEITYFHVELPEHSVILAQGLACESYLNTGDRSAFANGGGAVALHPDLSALRWEGLACADLVLTGDRLASIRADLAALVPREPVRSAA